MLLEVIRGVKNVVIGARPDGILIVAVGTVKWVRPSGETVAINKSFDRTRCIKEMVSVNSYVVAPDGRVFDFCLSEKGLEVYALGPEVGDEE